MIDRNNSLGIILEIFFSNTSITYSHEDEIKKLKDVDNEKMFLIENDHVLMLKIMLIDNNYALCFNINKNKTEIINLNTNVYKAINIFGKYEM